MKIEVKKKYIQRIRNRKKWKLKTSLPSLSGIAACAAMHKTNKNTATVKLM